MALFMNEAEDALQVLRMLKLDVMFGIFKYTLDKALTENDTDTYNKIAAQLPITALEMLDEVLQQEVIEGEEEHYKSEVFKTTVLYEKEVGEAFGVLENGGLDVMVRVFKFGLKNALQTNDFKKHNRISAQILKTTMKLIKKAQSAVPIEETKQPNETEDPVPSVKI